MDLRAPEGRFSVGLPVALCELERTFALILVHERQTRKAGVLLFPLGDLTLVDRVIV